MPNIPDIMNLTEAAAYLRVSEETLTEMAERSQIPARKLNDEWRFWRRAVEVWLSAHSGMPADMLYTPLWVPEIDLDVLATKIRDMVLAELAKSTGHGFAIPKRPSKEARKKVAGAFKDDPFLEKIVEDAYKERGRPIVAEDK